MNNTSNIYKKTELLLRIAKIVLFALAFFWLLGYQISTTETQELYTMSGGQRYIIETKYNSFWTDFLGRMSYLDSIGFAPVLEVILLIVVALNIIVAVAAIFPKFAILNKPLFLAFPLAVVVLCIAVMVDGDCSHLIGIEGPLYIDGLNVYLKEEVRFYLWLEPFLICWSAAFIISILPSVWILLKNKIITPKNNAPLPIVNKIEKENFPQETRATNDAILEELKKFKELLDMDIITQEEFDAKKKELLGL